MTTEDVTTEANDRGRFGAIEGLRAFAALAVLLYHTVTHYNVFTLEYATWEWINRLGNFGVSVFFLISGFLLFRPFVVSNLVGSAAPNHARFYTRRFLRIIPAYWVAFSAAAIAAYVTFGDWTDWLTGYALLGNYRGGYQLFGLGVEWTLAIEVSFYLVLPMLAAGLARLSPADAEPRRKVRGYLVGLAALYVATMLTRIWYLWRTGDTLAPRGVWFPIQQVLDKTIIGYFDWFAIGMAVAVGSAWRATGGRLPWPIERLAANPLVSWLLAAQAYWVALQLNLPVSVFDRVTRVQTFGIAFVYGFVALLLLIPAVFNDGTSRVQQRVFENRIIVWLGTISYGIYLWHLIVIKRIEQWTTSGAIDANLALWLALVAGITLAFAVVSWHLVERPFIRLSGQPWVGRITDPTTRPPRFGPRSFELRSIAELLGASGIAFAQPVLDLLGKNPSIFLDRNVTSTQAIVFAVLIVVGPPLAIYLLELTTSLVSARLRRAVHVIALAALLGLFALQFAKTLTEWSPTPLVITAFVVGALAIVALVRFRQVALLLRYLAVAGALYGLLFLGFSPASDAFFGSTADPFGGNSDVGNPKRVVMILFDELPTSTLLDETGAVDADLFPNFARLADRSTWYRNATTVSPYTQTAVPSLVTGQYPERNDALPSASEYPESVFTTLSGSYTMNVHEAVTSLCPTNICVDQSTGGGFRGLVSVTRDLWTEFAAPSRSEFSFNEFEGALQALPTARRFQRSIAESDRPQLDFVHVELPHQPWHYLPDLRDTTVIGGAPGSRYFSWSDQESADVAFRRHVIQTQAADTVLGNLITKLEANRAWDDSIVVVGADHGIAFENDEPLRSVSESNFDDVMWVPLFVHYPGEATGRVDDRPALTIDVMPTIADVLEIEDTPEYDGRSLRDEPRDEGPRRMYQNGELIFEPPDALAPPEGKQYLEFDGTDGWARLLDDPGLPGSGDPLRVYRRGRYGDLVGRRVSEFTLEPQGPEVTYLGNQGAFDNVALASRQVPWAYGEGYVNRLAEESQVALALNGTIANVATARMLNDEGDAFYMVMVPPSLMVEGKNELAVYIVTGSPNAPSLRPVALNR